MSHNNNDYKVVIQARMGSQRFPGKVLTSLVGRPLLAQQLQLLKEAGFQNLLVATSTHPNDQNIVKLCNELNVESFCGDEENVFSRYLNIARNCSTKHLIRLTGDNPIICSAILRQVISEYEKSHAHFASTRIVENEKVQRFIPKGWSVDIFSLEAIEKAALVQLTPYDLEHVIPVFYKIDIAKHIVKSFANMELENCSVDTTTDLEGLERNLQKQGGLHNYIDRMNQKVISYLKDQSIPTGGLADE